MDDWEGIGKLGAYLGIAEEIAGKLASDPCGGHLLEVILLSKGAIEKRYPGDAADLILRTILETDLLSPDDGKREEALARDVYRRVARRLELNDSFDEFDGIFRKFLGWFKAALEAVLRVRGLKEEDISLESPGVRYYLAELNELPCKSLEAMDLSHGAQAYGNVSHYVEALLEKYTGNPIPRENCESIVAIMKKASSHPDYFKALHAAQKLVEMRPILLAISELQLYPAKEPAKTDLLSALSILLFNVFPAPKLLKFITRFEPGPENAALSYEYNAILAINFMRSGKPAEAAGHNEKALGFAGDDEKKAYVHILDSCIGLRRRDYAGAIDSLTRCFTISKDDRMRARARFYMGIIYYETGNVAGALECFKLARAGLHEDLDVMSVYNNIGACALLRGEHATAAEAFENVGKVGRSLNCGTAKALRSVASGSLGIMEFSAMNYDRAVGYFKEALRLDRDTHDKKGAADQLGNIGLALKMKQDNRHSLEYFKSALGVSLGADYLEGMLFALGQIGQLLALEGKYEGAEALKQDAIRRNPGIAGMLKK